MARTPGNALSVAVLVALAGCKLAPPPKPADYRGEALPAMQVAPQWTGGETSGPLAAGWLKSFGDPQLEALVTEAVAHNPDLRVAAARVQVAAEYAELSDAT